MSGRTYEDKNDMFTTLQREQLDWGVTVAEKKIRKGLTHKLFLASCFLISFTASLYLIPLLIGYMLQADMTNLTVDMLIIVGCIIVAAIFNVQSRRGPRNAIEVDHDAAEVRLGSMSAKGAFVRHRVLALHKIEDVYVREGENGENTLNFVVGEENLAIALADSKLERLNGIAAQVREAAERARTMPRRSRIVSALHGLGANYREIGNRVASRIYS